MRSAVDAARRRSMVVHRDKSPCLISESGQLLVQNIDSVEHDIQARLTRELTQGLKVPLPHSNTT